jgi:hypothetical protein
VLQEFSMTILLWTTLGLTIGVSASRVTSAPRRVPIELALGLAASIAGGLLAIILG